MISRGSVEHFHVRYVEQFARLSKAMGRLWLCFLFYNHICSSWPSFAILWENCEERRNGNLRGRVCRFICIRSILYGRNPTSQGRMLIMRV